LSQRLRHAIGYLGRFERSFATLKPGVRRYVREDGSFGDVDERPRDADGVFFGYMECDGKRFVAVRVQHGSDDLVVRNPVPLDPPRHTDGKGFGPNPSRFGDDSAERLLIDLIAANPAQASELKRVAEGLGWRTTEAG
jgi:hypothetical protein